MPTDPPRFAVYRHGKQWYVRFSAGGRQRRVPVCPQAGVTPADARGAALQIVEAAIAQSERAEKLRAEHPLRLYAARLESRSLSYRANCLRYEQRLVDFFGAARGLRAIERRDVERWRDWLLQQPRQGQWRGQGRLSPKSVKEHLDWLAAVYRHAGWPNPCAGVERPRITDRERQEKIKFFSPDEMQRLFSVVQDRAFANAFRFLAFTGCRVGEARGLRPEHCDPQARLVYLVGKGQRRRPLRLTGPCAPAWQALVDQHRVAPRLDGHVFPQSGSWFQDSLRSLCRAADLPAGNPHMLRHTFASMALLYWRPPWPIATLAKWLGHRDINTTYRIYAHWIAAEAPSAWDFGSVLAQPETEAE